MNSRLMLVDGENLLYRVFYKFGGLTSKDGTPSECIYGLPYVLRSLLTKLKPNRVIVAFDGGRDSSRLEKLPGYKDREKRLGFDFTSFSSQKGVLMALLPSLNCQVVYARGFEADDLIYLLTRKYADWDITIVSGDKDFHQLISDTISIYYPNKEIILTGKNLKHYFEYTPKECVDYLCLIGDKSDKIPGVPGIGPKRARQFLDKWGSIKAYLDSGSNEYPKLTKGLYRLNKYLIDLRYFYILQRKNFRKLGITKSSGGINLIEVAKISRKYNINTFVKTDFIDGFKRLGK